jgi:hypothetical protein
MAKPVSMMPVNIRGFARDFAIDQLPPGYVWNLVDYIPNRHQSGCTGRGAWTLISSNVVGGTIWGGYHAPYAKGAKLLVCGGGGQLWDQTGWADPDLNSQAAVSSVGSMFTTGRQNGVMLHDRVYFADANGLQAPKYVTYNGTSLSIGQLGGANVPKATVLAVYKGRVLAGGDPANTATLFFSPLEATQAHPQGPLGDWDNKSFITMSRAITGIMPMPSSVLIFHDGMIEKVRGAVPPETNGETDMATDVFTAQMGCIDTASIVPWEENVIFANMKGVHLTDGSTIRSLTDQGGIGDAWREIYRQKRSGTQVCAEVYLNQLYVSILTNSINPDLRSFLFVCDLTARTWYRFANVEATAMIRANTGGEEIWWGVDPTNRTSATAPRLARLSPLVMAQREANTEAPLSGYPNIIDPDGNTVLPQIETGWMKLSRPEVAKRIRHIYLSHNTQANGTVEALKVSAKVSAAPFTAYQDLGTVPTSPDYERRRVRYGRPGYGLQVKVEQVLPTHITSIYDIGVEAWTGDGGRL